MALKAFVGGNNVSALFFGEYFVDQGGALLLTSGQEPRAVAFGLKNLI